MTIVQNKFRNRDEEDSRNFNVWYHNEDVQYLTWLYYQQIPASQKEDMLEPYIFFDGIGDTPSLTFDRLMEITREYFSSSKKTYFPFIFKPEIGGAHYMAGIVRKNSDGIKLFLFNPLGYEKEYAKRRLQLASSDKTGGMDLIFSPHKIQDKEKEDGPLVSCGPLCVEFLKYAMENPNWVADLDEAFILPEEFTQYTKLEKTEYQSSIKKLREKHDNMLGKITDEHVDTPLDFFASTTMYFFEKINPTQESLSEDDEFHYEDETSEDFSNKEYFSFSESEEYLIEEFEEEINGLMDVDDFSPEKAEANSVPSMTKYNQQKIEQAKNAYYDYLEQLNIKIKELINKGNRENPMFNPAYITVAKAAMVLETRLREEGKTFFAAPSEKTFNDFKHNITSAIETASQDFRQHRGLWHNLNPLIKGFLGVLAALTIIPALTVAATARHGYMKTFFMTPPTDAENQLRTFKRNIESEDGPLDNIDNEITLKR